MEPSPATLRRLLADSRTEAGIGLDAIDAWWSEEQTPGESLAAFLLRQGILEPDAVRTLGLIDKGYLSSSCARSIFTERGLGMLRKGAGASQGIDAAPDRGDTRRSQAAPTATAVATQWRKHRPAEPAATLRPSAADSMKRARGVASTQPVSVPPPARPRSWPPTRGTTLGKYLLTEQIGKGTSGVVFRAVNQTLNLSVAIKVLCLPEDGSAGHALETLAAEARILASLNHPNVVRLWDLEADPAAPYMVMEYVEGLSLAELIEQSGRLSLERALDLIGQAAEGLNAAWQLGIVHRDVKPHNILVGRDGRPKIVDLGLAVVLDGSSPGGQSEVAGTAAYMAPEQGLLSGGPIDFRSDVYSLGATLYHALTGRPPHRGGSVHELMRKHAQEVPAPPHLVVAGLSEAVSDVVLTMMAVDPGDRYQGIEELRAALRDAEPAPQIVGLAPAPEPYPSASASRGLVKRSSGFFKRLFVNTSGGRPDDE